MICNCWVDIAAVVEEDPTTILVIIRRPIVRQIVVTKLPHTMANPIKCDVDFRNCFHCFFAKAGEIRFVVAMAKK